MSDETPQPILPRSIIRQHIPGHSDGMQQDLPLWQHISMSQPQPATGVQAVPVGIGFANRPQQQLWPDHTPQFSQRGWQPLPATHTQQSPQETQDLNPQVVRSQHQNWQGGAGDVNPLQLQQLQHLIWLQQQQQQQQQMQAQMQQQQQQQHHHQTEPSLHHVDTLGQHDQDVNHDKFTKSPSPQVEEPRHSPLTRPYVQNVTSPQQQLWQHPQIVHQFDVQHSDSPHTPAFQQTPTVSHHQQLFTPQQQYVQPMWQHAPYSQVQLQHLRQSTPPVQQHLLWQQQQQHQQQQQQPQPIQPLQQQPQHVQQHNNSDSLPPYSPPSSNQFSEKPTFPEKKDESRTEQDNSFLGNRLTNDSNASNNNKLKPYESPVNNSVNNAAGLTSTASISSPAITSSANQIRILSKSSQSTPSSDLFVPPAQKPTDSFPSMTSSTSSQSMNQRSSQSGMFTLNNISTPPPNRPQNFNPNPTQNPYQSLNQPAMGNKNFTGGLYGNPNRFQAPSKDIGMNSASPTSQFRPRSPNLRSQQPNSYTPPGIMQRGPNIPAQAPGFNRMEHIEVNLFVSGLNPRTSGDSVRHYFEFVGRPSEVKDRVLFGIDHTDALVTFLQKPDIFKMKQNVRARKLDGFSLDIWEVPPPRAVVVSSDVPVRSVDSLVNYFERESVGGGRMKKNGVDETEDGCCILEFDDYRVVPRLCQPGKQHRVDGILLRVSPYYRCENGAVWDTTLHMVPVPKPVNIQILPDQLEFVKKYCQAQFSTRMREKFAEVTYSKDHVTVRCTLRQSMPNYRMLVRGWETGVQEAVAKFLGETIDQSNVSVPDQIWDKFIEWFNAAKADSKDMLIKQDRERKHLKLVGLKGNLKHTNQLIAQKIDALSRAARRKTESRKVKSPEKLLVVELQGTISALCRKYIDMKIKVDGNDVTIEGDPTDIPNAYKDLYTECDKVEPFTFKHTKTREFSMFCKKEASRKFVQRRLDQKMIRGAWNISTTEISVYCHKKSDSEIIKNIIYDCILEKSLPVEKTSTSLLNSEVWGDFAGDKMRRYKDRVEIYVKKQTSVLVVGQSDLLQNLIQQIKDFLDEKTVKTVLVACDSIVLEFINGCWTENDFIDLQKCEVAVKKKVNGLELTGLSEKLIAAKQKLDAKLKRLCSKRHAMKRIGVYDVVESLRAGGTLASYERDCKCVLKLPPELDKSAPLKGSHFETLESGTSPAEDAVPSTGPRCFQTRHHKIKIHLVHGELGSQKADVIVCHAAANLNLKSGSASYSLVKAGGNQLQSDCTRLYPSGIADGDVAVIAGGNLACDQVYLTSLPSWRDIAHTGGKLFRDFMRETLRLADCSNKKSITYLAMGCGGYLGYPRELVAAIMYGVVAELDASYSKTSLKDVSIVMGGKDGETIKAYEDQEQMRIHGCASVGPMSSDFVKGKIKIELVTDDLAKQQVDALLCSVSTDMSLTRNAICKSLVEVGGRALQEECKQKYNNELAAGKVVDISGASLPCKTIYLTVLPTYTDSSIGEQNMIGVLQTALQLANLKGYQSIAIPALGTGHCSYPKVVSARCMYDAVLDWVAKNPKASIKLVRFVMYSKDTEAQQAFRACHQRILGKEIRACRSLQGDTSLCPSKMAATKYRMIQNGVMLDMIKLSVVVGDIVSTAADILINPVGANFDMSGTVSQALMKQCPNILPECQQKKAELRKEGMVFTGASELKASFIGHMLNQDTLSAWRTKITTCLEEAAKRSAKCVAIPLLGTGPGGKLFPADSMAECLYCAVDDFANRNPKTALTQIQLVITEQNHATRPKVLSAFQEKVTATLAPPSSGNKFLKRSSVERTGPHHHHHHHHPHSAMSRHRAMSEMLVVVHSDAILNIDKCIRMMDDKLGLEYCRKTLEVDAKAVKALSDKQLDNIVDSSLLLDIKLDRKTGRFTVQGPYRSVLAAIDTIQTRLQVYTNEQQNKAEAETLAAQVRWHYEDSGPLEKREVPYDILINQVVERAYLIGKPSVELFDTEKRAFIVDFQRLVEYRKEDKTDMVRVIRKDVLKGDSPVPSSWMSMSNNENVKKVTLATNDREYQKVEKALMAQLRSGLYSNKMKNKQHLQVLKIERIQNRSLYQQFASKKKVMEQQKTGNKQVERQLWQCSTDDNLASVINHGFNRSYCGTNGVLYGQGVYFGVDASYSVQPYIGGSKPGTRRYIFMVRTLTGEAVKGNPSLRQLPPVSSAHPATLYDSAVDDIKKPMEYVIFHDAQAYPEYLITFSM